MIDWSGFRFQDPVWLWAGMLGPLVVIAEAVIATFDGR